MLLERQNGIMEQDMTYDNEICTVSPPAGDKDRGQEIESEHDNVKIKNDHPGDDGMLRIV